MNGRSFDGIICFGGEDWWYHNPGHYDMQLMRRLAGEVPVLYVNSIGMRLPDPREGRMFLRRVGRKLASAGRGLTRLSDRLAVVTPVFAPGNLTARLTRPLLARRVRSAARRMGIRQPLVWIACPTAAEVVDDLAPAAVVYQRTDSYERFPGVNGRLISRFDRWLKARADLTVFCARTQFDREARDCADALWIDHGVDLDRFVRADRRDAEPSDIAGLPRPRAGFVGALDAHTFDAALFLEVAGRLPDVHFVLVGDSTLPRHWCTLDNVTLLGRRPYETVPDYAAACDVLIMPWNRSPWIESCNPVKLKEYLAAGRPVVTTPFRELERYEGLVARAHDADAFVDAVRSAIAERPDPEPGREFVAHDTWPQKADEVLTALSKRAIVPVGSNRNAPMGAMGKRQLARAASKVPRKSSTQEHGQAALAHGTQKGQKEKRNGVATTPVRPPVACIVLAGGLRPSPLVAAAGQSVLDLWLTPDRTVLDQWIERAREVSPEIAVRVVHDSRCPAPWPVAIDNGVTFEQDPKSLRGTAGILRDVCRSLDPDATVLVTEAARYPAVSLEPVAAAHAREGRDVTVVANPDGAPAGVYLIRCGSLELVPPRGFMDLKEQWLPRVQSGGHTVHVAPLPEPGVLPLRTRRQFLAAARVANPVAGAGMRVVCPGGLIGPGATVIDSIVMPGAVVGAGAVVVRSLMCPDTRTLPGADVVDSIVPAGERG